MEAGENINKYNNLWLSWKTCINIQGMYLIHILAQSGCVLLWWNLVFQQYCIGAISQLKPSYVPFLINVHYMTQWVTVEVVVLFDMSLVFFIEPML